MDQRADVDDMLRRHRPQKWRPWRCQWCGNRLPCSARRLALECLVIWTNREREAHVFAQLRKQASQANRRPPTRGGMR